MPPRKKKTEDATPVRTHHHPDHQRPLIPDAAVTLGDLPKTKRQDYAYNPHLDPILLSDPTRAAERILSIIDKVEKGVAINEEDKRILKSVATAYEQPWLEWSGKREACERRRFQVDDVLLHIHERISPQAIINAVRRDEEHQSDLFAKPKVERDRQVQYYRHSMGWSNRLILGDSLQVMSSLARRENLAGQVQMVFIDPPYGVKFSSNWQNEVANKDVKDKDGDVSREPEMIRAYRDTWHLGVHSYLSYLRQRFQAARELLTESGSIFVQISDDNLHYVRSVLEEVFGAKNFCKVIFFRTTQGDTSHLLPNTGDYVIWFAKSKEHVKYRKLFVSKDLGVGAGAQYKYMEDENGQSMQVVDSPDLSRFSPYTIADLRRTGFSNSASFDFQCFGRNFSLGPNRQWKTGKDGMRRLLGAEWLVPLKNLLMYKRYFSHFPVTELNNCWTDTRAASERQYVVQTSETIIQRCMLMTSDPGDLILDPTCGSGTTAQVAEQWGRRWITIDTSRVALSIARQRLATAVFEVYKVKDPNAGIDPSAPLNPSCGFECKTVPHIMLKTISRNAALDPIIQKHDLILREKLSELNVSLKSVTSDLKAALIGKLLAKINDEGFKSLTDADIRRWLLPQADGKIINVGSPSQRSQLLSSIPSANGWNEWEVPFDFDPDWPKPLKEALAAYRAAWRIKMSEVNSEIAKSADQEVLVDQPYVLKGAMRVSGPFCVEGVRPEELVLGEDGKVFDATNNDDGGMNEANVTQYLDRMLSLLRMDGVTFLGNRHVKFKSLERSMVDGIHGLGVYETAENDILSVGVVFGPQYGPVNAVLVASAVACIKNQTGIKELVIAGFSFDAAAQQKAREASADGIQVNIAHIRPDVSPGMDGLLKDQRNSQLFTVFGQPEFKAKSVGAGEYQVELGGVCVYNPLTGMVESSNASKVAAWFLDADYDGQCFCVSQAFFPDSKAWEKIAKALGSKEDEAAFEAFAGTTSLPFKLGQHRRVAIKVIDPRGNEVMGIKTIA